MLISTMEENTPIQPIVSKKIIKIFDDYYGTLIKKIGDKYNLNQSDLFKEFKPDSTKIAIELGIKKRNRRVLEVNKRCLGRKFDGCQCTRSKRENSDFCLSHEKNLPQGRIDDSNYKPKEKGKRGRKKKIHAFANNDDYIATQKININDIDYLLDNEGKVYTYNIEEPHYLGTYDDTNRCIIDKN